MNRTNFTWRSGVIPVKSAICEEKGEFLLMGEIDKKNVIIKLMLIL
jgi:hypothetical protein